MKKPYIILLLIYLLPSFSKAQSSIKRPKWFGDHDTAAYYMSADTQLAYNEQTAKFLRLVIIPKEGSVFEIQDYYMDGKPKLTAYSTVGKQVFHSGSEGPYIEYYKEGGKRSKRFYQQGKLVGDEIMYYPNGNVMSVVSHDGTGIFLKTFQDSTGKVLTAEGNGLWRKVDLDDPGRIFEGTVVNGREDGTWLLSGVDSVPRKIIYSAGKMLAGNEYLDIKPQIFTSVEMAPSFPGGDAAFGNYLGRTIHYPKIALQNNIQGRVILTFVVEKNGALSDVKVVRGIGGGCDEEAVRALQASPSWHPGIQNGKPVRVQYSVPVAFSLQHDTVPLTSRQRRN